MNKLAAACNWLVYLPSVQGGGVARVGPDARA